MEDDDSPPTLTADELNALIEASLSELKAGKGQPMSAFIAELKADFRAAYPEVVEMLQPPQADHHSHD